MGPSQRPCVGAARADAATASLRRDQATVEAAARLALVYAEAEAAQRRYDLAEEALAVTIADARAALILVEEGREPMLRGIQGETEAAAARAARDEAGAERDAAFARLTAVAMSITPLTSIETSLIDRTPTSAETPASATPQVRVAEAERAAAESRIAVERVRAAPDVTASVGVRRYEAEDATALTFGLSLPLPLFDRNRGNIEAAQADFRAASARLMSARTLRRTEMRPRRVFGPRPVGSRQPTPGSPPARRLIGFRASASRPGASPNWSCDRPAPPSSPPATPPWTPALRGSGLKSTSRACKAAPRLERHNEAPLETQQDLADGRGRCRDHRRRRRLVHRQ